MITRLLLVLSLVFTVGCAANRPVAPEDMTALGAWTEADRENFEYPKAEVKRPDLYDRMIVVEFILDGMLGRGNRPSDAELQLHEENLEILDKLKMLKYMLQHDDKEIKALWERLKELEDKFYSK